MGKRMEALTAQSPLYIVKHLENFGPLTPEFTVMVWQPFMRQMGEISETRSILGTLVVVVVVVVVVVLVPIAASGYSTSLLLF